MARYRFEVGKGTTTESLSSIITRVILVYCLMRKSDAFATFKDYNTWAENITWRRIGILREDKGGEFSRNE